MGRAQEGICWLCPPLRRGWGAAYFVFEADQTSRVTQGPEPRSRPVPCGTSGRPACPRGGFSDTLFGQTHSPPAAPRTRGALRSSPVQRPKVQRAVRQLPPAFRLFPFGARAPCSCWSGKAPTGKERRPCSGSPQRCHRRQRAVMGRFTMALCSERGFGVISSSCARRRARIREGTARATWHAAQQVPSPYDTPPY